MQLSCLQDAVLIGSRLDASQEAATCRLAFYGRILKLLDPNDATALQQIKIYKLKQKKGSIDRVTPDGLSAVCKGMFKKETDIGLFSGMKVGAAPWLLLLVSLFHCFPLKAPADNVGNCVSNLPTICQDAPRIFCV